LYIIKAYENNFSKKQILIIVVPFIAISIIMADYQQLVDNFMKNKSLSFDLRNKADDSKKSVEPLPRRSSPDVVEPEEPEAKKRRKPSGNGVVEDPKAAAVLSKPRPCAKAENPENVQPAEPKKLSVSALAQGLCQQIHAAATQRKMKIHTMVHGILMHIFLYFPHR
jgi:hypothetical protein